MPQSDTPQDQDMKLAIERAIEICIKDALSPHHFELSNDSNQHRGPRDAASHFSAVIVSDLFEGQSQVQRQQRVFGILCNIMPKIHALSLVTSTVPEWKTAHNKQLDLPKCKSAVR